MHEYTSLQEEAADLQTRVDRMRSEISSPKAQVISDMPRIEGSGRTEDMLAELIDMCDYYKKVRKNLLGKQFLIEQEIQQINSSILRRIMRHKLIDGMSFDEIADEVCYSARHIKRLYEIEIQKMSLFADVKCDIM